MKNDIIKIYNNFVSNNFIDYDLKQVEILEEIELVFNKNKKISFFSKSKKMNGIYIYGSVGIGKTFIINLFIKNISKSKKIHFNHFMIDLHAYINNSLDKGDALEFYIKKLAKNINVLFIDELHIFNIVDALLIKKIFIFFQKYKIFVLISSNFMPNELYKDGLQRNDFIPFINFLENNYKILFLQNFKDYRRLLLNQSKTYFTPIKKETSYEFDRLFQRFVDKSEIHIRKIKIKSRVIRFQKCIPILFFVLLKNYVFLNWVMKIILT